MSLDWVRWLSCSREAAAQLPMAPGFAIPEGMNEAGANTSVLIHTGFDKKTQLLATWAHGLPGCSLHFLHMREGGRETKTEAIVSL